MSLTSSTVSTITTGTAAATNQTITTTSGGISTTGVDYWWTAPNGAPKTLHDLFNGSLHGMVVFPILMFVGLGSTKISIVNLLKELHSVPYVETATEVAVPRPVADAIATFMKSNHGYAGLSIADFIKGALSAE